MLLLNTDTKYLLPLAGADLAYLMDTLEDHATLRVPTAEDLDRVLQNVAEEHREQVILGFEEGHADASFIRNRAISIRNLIGEARRRPTEFSI